VAANASYPKLATPKNSVGLRLENVGERRRVLGRLECDWRNARGINYYVSVYGGRPHEALSLQVPAPGCPYIGLAGTGLT
jgi:hypothetical protein